MPSIASGKLKASSFYESTNIQHMHMCFFFSIIFVLSKSHCYQYLAFLVKAESSKMKTTMNPFFEN